MGGNLGLPKTISSPLGTGVGLRAKVGLVGLCVIKLVCGMPDDSLVS